MKYLLLGGSGKLGQELQRLIDCYALSRKDFDVTSCLIKNETDFSQYDKIILAAAYTDVPKAEVERKLAIEINVFGARNVAKVFNKKPIVYISTDYVYDGEIGNYREDDPTRPFT